MGEESDAARAAFDRVFAELRPKLHRYCARMTGSVIDGEDVVQVALDEGGRGLAACRHDRRRRGLAVPDRA